MKIIIENVNSRIENASSAEHERLRSKLTTFSPGYRYTYQYKKKLWDGKVRIYQEDNPVFPTGMLPQVVKEIGSSITEIEDQRFIRQLQLQDYSVGLRTYQEEAVTAALYNSLYDMWWPRGVLMMATGGGKTETAVAIIQLTRVPTLFLVNRSELVKQAIDRFARFGIKAGAIMEGSMDLNNQVTVATIQSLMYHARKINQKTKTKVRTAEELTLLRNRAKERKKLINAFLFGIEQVFIDEAHFIAASDMAKGNLFVTALNMMPNAYMRWGLTATPFMRDEYHNWLLSGTTGGLLYEVHNRELIDAGYLAEADVTMYTVPKTEGVPNSWPDCYDLGVVLNRKRNLQIVKDLQNQPGPTLVLVKSLGHGKILSQKSGVPFVQGSSKASTRSDYLEQFRNGQLNAIIASSIWDEGVDIPEIKTLILAAGGKGKIKNLQRLGRGLRLSDGKASVNVIDFYDHSTKWLKAHSKARERLWKEQGFTVTTKDLDAL
jgi:superfamily II DNA or RNA helicase